MRKHSGKFPVKKMAEVLGVSRSRYYSYLKNPMNRYKMDDEDLKLIIQDIYEANRRLYGSPRIFRELRKRNTRCSRKRVARIMRENSFKGRQKGRFKVTTNSNHNYPVSPNLLNREFKVSTINSCWVSDISYIRTNEGWLYLCVVIDLYSRKVVGYSLDTHIRAELAMDALKMAVVHRNPDDNLIFHSDRGVQYASHDFRKVITEYKMIQSMSRKGDCWDNACAESFFSTLKMEEVFHKRYKTRDEARLAIFEYISVFYNRQRIHSFLDYKSPEEYESSNSIIKYVA